MAYRYRAAAEAGNRFASVFSYAGDHYTQEEALFAFFVNATSTIECLLFSMFCLGAIFKPRLFAMDNDGALQQISPEHVRKHFTRAFSGSPLAKAVERLVKDPARQRILDFRNFMAHRGSLPREYDVRPKDPRNVRIPEDAVAAYVRAQPKSAVDSKTRLKLEADLAVPLRIWLSGHLRAIIEAAVDYCKTHPASPS